MAKKKKKATKPYDTKYILVVEGNAHNPQTALDGTIILMSWNEVHDEIKTYLDNGGDEKLVQVFAVDKEVQLDITKTVIVGEIKVR